ncbi:hypothetical protein [Escherichia coli]|uniref:hypothetical protein n=1 Tax=Escherichia coli TaxID=562 RepID=UPI00190FF372|nr:hypothetical protein [Escherichia coli]
MAGQRNLLYSGHCGNSDRSHILCPYGMRAVALAGQYCLGDGISYVQGRTPLSGDRDARRRRQRRSAVRKQ